MKDKDLLIGLFGIILLAPLFAEILKMDQCKHTKICKHFEAKK